MPRRARPTGRGGPERATLPASRAGSVPVPFRSGESGPARAGGPGTERAGARSTADEPVELGPEVGLGDLAGVGPEHPAGGGDHERHRHAEPAGAAGDDTAWVVAR